MVTSCCVRKRSQNPNMKMCLSIESIRRTMFVAIVVMCFASVQAAHVVEMKLTSSEPLSLNWGIGDATAYVGKVFTYTLPSDAFQGNVVHYDITEVGKDTLPSWLSFNPLKAELKGIPGQQGRVYLEVKATGDDNSHADDVFSIEVLDDTYGSLTSLPTLDKMGPKYVKCSRHESQTIVTVIIDCDVDSMPAGDRLGLLDNMAGHLNLTPEMLKMLPVGDKPMFDSSSLVSGPGNVKSPLHAGGLVSWLVGCGKVEKDHMPILQMLEDSAANGDMSGALGHGIIGWHVTNSHFQEKHRKRRAITATPTLTVPPPTRISESTTDDMTKPAIESTSMYVQPTKTMDIQPTKVVTSSSSSSSSTITPTETIKMTKTDEVMSSTTTTTTTTTTVTTTPTSTTSTTKKTTTTPTTTKKLTTTMKPEVVTPEPECPPFGRVPKKAPKLKNPIKNFTLESGVIKKIKISEDMFFDCYDDATSDLDLEITKTNGRRLPSDFWIKVIRRPTRPYSLLMNPLNTDAGTYSFRIKVTNFYSKSASQDFGVVVLGEENASNPPNHEVSMTLDTDYDSFMSNIENRVELSNKVANLYGDRNSKYLTVTRLEKGSVVYAWTNNSLSGPGCPTDELRDNVNKLVDENGNLTPEVQDAMQPYKINSIASAPLGACENNPNFPVRNTRRVPLTTHKPMANSPPITMAPTSSKDNTVTVKYDDKTTKAPEEKTTAAVAAAGAGGGSDMWITTVVPAIVVVVVLIIALIIACCLYRKKRQGRMKLQDKDHFSNNKGVPVIFADEYEEKPNDSTRPLIMEDEKPPMPPPEYPRASSETSGNSNSTQPIDDRDIEEIEMETTDITSPLYSPPPPVTASSNSKPPHVQSSRGPPPYVPP